MSAPPQGVHVHRGEHGWDVASLTHRDGSRVVVQALGAQITSWIDAQRGEQLFLSRLSPWEEGRAIVGGIAVCFPHFTFAEELRQPQEGGLLSAAAAAAARVPPREELQGFACTQLWHIEAAPPRPDSIHHPYEGEEEQAPPPHRRQHPPAAPRSESEDADPSVTLRLVDSPETYLRFPHAFQLTLTVTLRAGRLATQLQVLNAAPRRPIYTPPTPNPRELVAALEAFYVADDDNRGGDGGDHGGGQRQRLGGGGDDGDHGGGAPTPPPSAPAGGPTEHTTEGPAAVAAETRLRALTTVEKLHHAFTFQAALLCWLKVRPPQGGGGGGGAGGDGGESFLRVHWVAVPKAVRARRVNRRRRLAGLAGGARPAPHLSSGHGPHPPAGAAPAGHLGQRVVVAALLRRQRRRPARLPGQPPPPWLTLALRALLARGRGRAAAAAS
jgi:hypothetical protein